MAAAAAAAASHEQSRRGNIVMFPFMAQGHIIPFLALSLHIHKTTNFTITLINTPQNIKNILNSSSLPSAIRLHSLPFSPAAHGLPPEAENTDSVPYPLVIKLLHASMSLRQPFTEFLHNLVDKKDGPICVVSDFFFGWTAEVAAEVGVFHVVFSAAGAFGLACYYSAFLNLPHRNIIDSSPATDGDCACENNLADHCIVLPGFEDELKIHATQMPMNILQADGTDSWSIYQHKNLPLWRKSNGFLFNTVEEIDQVGLSFFKGEFNLPVWSIGPILLPSESRARKSEVTQQFLKTWLDSKRERSVLYISFGSQNTISASHMMQLGMALESSGQNFIWVVRPPIGFDINSKFDAEKWLPEGFEQRISESNRGLIVQNWAPQVEILGHKAVAAFLSHCGWNSTLEALSEGVLVLGWPMAAEQFFNCKMLDEQVGVCVEVARGKSYEVKSEDLVRKIGVVMGESDRGVAMRTRAAEVKEVIEKAIRRNGEFKGSSVKGLDDFFDVAMSYLGRREGATG